MKWTRLLLPCCLVIFALSVPFLKAQDAVITNYRVVEMTRMGLDDEIIIAKIKSGNCKFQLADTDLMDLKKFGVSSKVVAAMLDANVITIAKVTIDNTPVEMHTLGQAKVGGRMGSAFSYGLKSVKQKAYLQNPHSKVFTSPNPVIEIELPKAETIDSYIVVEMDQKSDRRELEVGSTGGVVGAKQGIRAESIRRTSPITISNCKFRLSVQKPLNKGEYIVYVVGSADHQRGIFGRGYDFTVE